MKTKEDWAKAIIMHLTGRPDDPTPMLLDIISKIIDEERKRCANLVRDWQDRAYSSDEVLRLIVEGKRVP